MSSLEVCVDGKLAGILLQADDGSFALDYLPDWVANRVGFSLSPLLGFTSPAQDVTARQHEAIVQNFFQNLLPEGEALEIASMANQVSKSNLMGLLLSLGRETAGALSLHLPGTRESPSAEPVLRPLPHQELHERILARPDKPFSVWDGKVRLSIAGFQDKVAVYEDAEGNWSLVDAGVLASTHILKPEPVRSQLAGMTTNEFACMRLAKAVRLPVAEVRLVHVPEPVLVVKRFDRAMESGRVRRVHCIDGCQALGIPSGWKYERIYGDQEHVQHIRDGASFRRLLPLAELAPHPAAAQLAMLRWSIFQVLIGNTDAHAKNLSFFWDRDGLRVAPAYDMVSTILYADAQIADTLAMAIGDTFDTRKIGAYDWALMAHECGISAKAVAKELKRMAEAVMKAWPLLLPALSDAGAHSETLARIGLMLEAQCSMAVEAAKEIPHVPAELF